MDVADLSLASGGRLNRVYDFLAVRIRIDEKRSGQSNHQKEDDNSRANPEPAVVVKGEVSFGRRHEMNARRAESAKASAHTKRGPYVDKMRPPKQGAIGEYRARYAAVWNPQVCTAFIAARIFTFTVRFPTKRGSRTRYNYAPCPYAPSPHLCLRSGAFAICRREIRSQGSQPPSRGQRAAGGKTYSPFCQVPDRNQVRKAPSMTPM